MVARDWGEARLGGCGPKRVGSLLGVTAMVLELMGDSLSVNILPRPQGGESSPAPSAGGYTEAPNSETPCPRYPPGCGQDLNPAPSKFKRHPPPTTPTAATWHCPSLHNGTGECGAVQVRNSGRPSCPLSSECTAWMGPSRNEKKRQKRQQGKGVCQVVRRAFSSWIPPSYRRGSAPREVKEPA